MKWCVDGYCSGVLSPWVQRPSEGLMLMVSGDGVQDAAMHGLQHRSLGIFLAVAYPVEGKQCKRKKVVPWHVIKVPID